MNQHTRNSLPRFLMLSIALFGLVACGNAENSDAATSAAGEEDEGAASMEIAGKLWEAEEAEAEINGTTLKIDASRTDFIDGSVSRQQLVLTIRDYQGAGEYQAAVGSVFVGVGIDTEKAAQARTDEQVRDTAASVLGESTSLSLGGAQVTITAADEREVQGVFRYEPPELLNRPSISNGTFRALLEQ